MDPQYYAEAVRMLRCSLEVGDSELCKELAEIYITEIQELMKSSTLTFPKKRSLQSLCGQLYTIKSRLEEQKSGGKLKRQRDDDEIPEVSKKKKDGDVVWADMESAFRNNIRCGVISNLKHLDISTFLESANELFKLKVREALAQHNSLKVDATLSAEYSIVKEDEEISEVKFFNTKNAMIFPTTELDEWFNEHIK